MFTMNGNTMRRGLLLYNLRRPRSCVWFKTTNGNDNMIGRAELCFFYGFTDPSQSDSKKYQIRFFGYGS